MDSYIRQLNDLGELLKQNRKMVDLIGDCPNIERPIAPETVFWKTIAEKKGYECQANLFSGKCRIVSPYNTRIANGSRNAMLEKMSRLAADDFFKKGDVIGVSRNGLYEHYGIYLGNGRVIHYSGENGDFGQRVSVHEAPFSEFIKDSKNCFVLWFDKGMPIKLQQATTFLIADVSYYLENNITRNKRTVFSADETVKRARERLGEENYNLVTNNCEHFAMWCKTGVSESGQVKQMIRFVADAGITGLGLTGTDVQFYLA